MKTKSNPFKTPNNLQIPCKRRGYPGKAGLKICASVLLFLAQFFSSHSTRAAEALAPPGEPEIFSTGIQVDLPCTAWNPTSLGSMLLTGGNPSTNRIEAGPELPSKKATQTTLENQPTYQPPPLILETEDRTNSPYEALAIFGLIALFVLSLNLEAVAKLETLIDLIALGLVSISETWKEMVTPKRRWLWTLRPR